MQELNMNCNPSQLASMPLIEKKHFAEIIANIKEQPERKSSESFKDPEEKQIQVNLFLQSIHYSEDSSYDSDLDRVNAIRLH
jgi:hypothetical protein